MPSMVVTLEPEACPASTVQDFTARPSIWTTQAPHWLVSQPTCVPVRSSWSRKTWTRSVRSSTSTETALPFTVSLTVDTYPSPNDFCLGGLETGEANFATGNFVAVVTERSSDMSGEVLEPHPTASQNMAMPARNAGRPRYASEFVPQNRGRRECRVSECTRSLVRDE